MSKSGNEVEVQYFKGKEELPRTEMFVKTTEGFVSYCGLLK